MFSICKLAYKKKYRILPEINIDVIDKGRVPDVAICDVNISFQSGEDAIKLESIPYGVIEILSPKQNLSELVQKSAEYFAVGVKSYWLVLPDLHSNYVYDPKGTIESRIGDARRLLTYLS